MHSTLKRIPVYESVLIWGLLLFSVSLALSKSASNILIGLLYLGAFYFAVRYQALRNSVLRTMRQPLLVPFALLLSAAVIGLLFSENLPAGIGIMNKLVGLLLVYLMFAALLDSLEQGAKTGGSAEKMLTGFLIGVALLNVIGAMTYLGIIGQKRFVLPLAPLHVHHIWFSNLNAIAIYTAMSFLLFSRRKISLRYRVALIAFILLTGVSILLSLSRTAWLGMFATTIILTAVMIKKKKIVIVVFAGMLVAVGLLYVFNQIVHSRMDQIVSDISRYFSGHAQTNIGERFLMWKSAIRMFLSNPLFGVGTGDYVLTMNRWMASGDLPPYLAEFNQPHNLYLFALATNGLLGLSALLYLFYRGLKFALLLVKQEGERRVFAFVALATIVHFMIAGMTDSFFNIQILRYTFAFVMGVCVRASLVSAQDP
jgi:O-antigen ligase